MNKIRMLSLARIRFESIMRKFVDESDFDRPDDDLVKAVLERYSSSKK